MILGFFQSINDMLIEAIKLGGKGILAVFLVIIIIMCVIIVLNLLNNGLPKWRAARAEAKKNLTRRYGEIPDDEAEDE